MKLATKSTIRSSTSTVGNTTDSGNQIAHSRPADLKSFRAEPWNRVGVGDFLELSRHVTGEKFDVVIADPPYNIGKDFGNGSDDLELDDYLDWTQRWLEICFGLLADHGIIYVYGFPEILAHVAVRYPLEQQRWLVWHYTNKTVPSLKFWQRSHESILCLWSGKRPNINIDDIREGYTDSYRKVIGRPRKPSKGRYNANGNHSVYNGHENGAMPRDVIKVPALAGGAGHRERWFLCLACDNQVYAPQHLGEHSTHEVLKHPTQKPMELTSRLLRSVIADGHGKLLLPFAGSGSEAVVAKSLGIDFFATELNPSFASLANSWLQQTARNSMHID